MGASTPSSPLCAIEENWDETLRFAASIRAGTVSASVMLRKLAGFPRQNPVARALREIGRVERTFENQRHRASGLTLVTAAVTLWNTVYLERAVRHLRGNGIDVSDELLAHVAPLGWEHVGLTGDYFWGEIDKPRERFRPLRLHQQSQNA